jgi:hypothetical protein
MYGQTGRSKLKVQSLKTRDGSGANHQTFVVAISFPQERIVRAVRRG